MDDWKTEQIELIKSRISELNLSMKVVDIEQVGQDEEDTKLYVFYKSRKRVDFRQLCRDLHRIYQCRIEMRRLSDRQIAQRLGGINTCKHSRIPCFIPWCHSARWGGCFYDQEEEQEQKGE